MLFVFSFVTSLLLVVLIVPWIVIYALKKQFFEASGERIKIHGGKIPHFGGVAIYIAVLFPILITAAGTTETFWLFLASLLIFGLGLIDDVKGISASSKFVFQFVAAYFVVVNGGVQILHIHRVLQFEGLTQLLGIIVSLLFVVGLVNAFNLIDGIDGLAGSVALLICNVYAYLFYKAGSTSMSYLSCSAVGALVAFLFFNVFSSRKIFMGDCGSLTIGLLIAFLSLKLLGIPQRNLAVGFFRLDSKVGLLAALLCIPLFDTTRVFLLRIMGRRSPFRADNNHIHHRLLSIGLSHLQATSILFSLNLGIAAFSMHQQALGNTKLIMIVIVVMICLNSLLTIRVNKTKKKHKSCVDFAAVC
ncbi:MAG: undecaprenyl-phosphate alpha-N-acetylglucosaminyl 1-phosphate transferase [Pedobacter sp.]|jgi:UDP-GlcNAc:undecaprenyl-phosphate GlcNAc-1-phosphate transferase|nr:undecaprenyl-phosphate alpha-N-acetylglucosaminyl 1-phosphate transferase [Pedobacter sp.]